MLRASARERGSQRVRAATGHGRWPTPCRYAPDESSTVSTEAGAVQAWERRYRERERARLSVALPDAQPPRLGFLNRSELVAATGRCARGCTPVRVLRLAKRPKPPRHARRAQRNVCPNLCTNVLCIGKGPGACNARRPRAFTGTLTCYGPQVRRKLQHKAWGQLIRLAEGLLGGKGLFSLKLGTSRAGLAHERGISQCSALRWVRPGTTLVPRHLCKEAAMPAETDWIRAMTFNRVWWFPLPALLFVLLMASSSTVAATPRCSDRADNDGDGLVDYPADPGCTSGTDDTELGNPPTHGWIFCANEHEFCSFSGTREVRYGANRTFTEPREFTDGVQCNNVTFGDPLPGANKHCETRGGTTPPPPSGFPASYFTGPLGQNNILPADPGGALVSSWAGFQGSTAQDVINQFTARQNAAGREIDVIATHHGNGATFNGAAQCFDAQPSDTVENWAISQGSVPYVSWTPGRSSANNDSIVRQVINGQRDACIDAVANHLEAKGVRIMLRPFHEFDYLQYHRRGDGSLDYTTEAAQGQALIDAWRRVVNRFQAVGATSVGFLWNPDEGGGSRSLVGQSYPGNAYVDWVGSDRYNWGPSTWSACDFFGWAEFWRIFNHNNTTHCGAQNYHDRFGVANGKPFFVGETSTRYDSEVPNRKNQWFADIRLAKDPTDSVRYMSNLIGVSIYDIPVAPENNSDWRIDSNQTQRMASAGQFGTTAPQHGLNGWVQWVNDPRWNVGVRP
jgi:hypothetical protein